MNEFLKKLKNMSALEFEQNETVLTLIAGMIRNRHIELSDQRQKNNQELIQKQIIELLEKTNYEDPEYPDFGIIGHKGSCFFSNQEEAEFLIKHLNNRSYYYLHQLNWEGSGSYIIIPKHEHDKSGEVIYTAIYKKETSL